MSDDTPPAALPALIRRGAAWTTLDVAFGRLGQFAQGVVIARILAPNDFGVFAVALVVHTIVINMSDLGVAAALIRDDDEQSQRAAPTVVTIAVVTGCLLGLLMAASAPLTARLLGSPKAASAIAVMALTLPLAGFSAVPTAFLRRHFRMDRIFVADMANTISSGVLVITLALSGWGPMALAWSWVAGQMLTTVLLLTYRPGRFRPGWAHAEVRRLLAFGLPLAGANIIAFSVLNVDYVVVGRLLGATALGLYVLAFNISGWPMNVLGTVVRSVSLPGFAHVQRDGADMPDRYLQALKLVATITLPICFILGAVGRPLVVTVYGQRWGLAATALVGLCVLGAGRILLELSGDFLVTLGRTRVGLHRPDPMADRPGHRPADRGARLRHRRGGSRAGRGGRRADATPLHVLPEPSRGATPRRAAGPRPAHGVGGHHGRGGLVGQPAVLQPTGGLRVGWGRRGPALRDPLRRPAAHHGPRPRRPRPAGRA